MKNQNMVKRGVGLLVIAAFLSGCGAPNDANTKIETQNAVEKALKEGVESARIQETESDSAEDAEASDETTPQSVQEEENSKEQADSNAQVAGEEDAVDIDLTSMSSDMIYATVYQMMITPELYVGKTVKIKGSYYASWYEPTEKYYHYVIVADASACCSQGIEFIWGDGEHIFPDEYPDYFAEVEVVGTFFTYTEPDDPSLYCALKDSTMKLASF